MVVHVLIRHCCLGAYCRLLVRIDGGLGEEGRVALLLRLLLLLLIVLRAELVVATQLRRLSRLPLLQLLVLILHAELYERLNRL